MTHRRDDGRKYKTATAVEPFGGVWADREQPDAPGMTPPRLRVAWFTLEALGVLVRRHRADEGTVTPLRDGDVFFREGTVTRR